MGNKKRKIGIDIDDTSAVFIPIYLDFHNNKFNTCFSIDDLKDYSFEKHLQINSYELANSFKDFLVNHTSLVDFPLLEYAKDSIIELSKRAEIYFITSRDKDIEEGTIQFLNKHFSDIKFKLFFSGEVNGTSQLKHEFCKEQGIKVVIDDSPVVCLNCAKIGIKVFLIDRPWNKDYQEHENIIKVKNWKEIMERLEK